MMQALWPMPRSRLSAAGSTGPLTLKPQDITVMTVVYGDQQDSLAQQVHGGPLPDPYMYCIYHEAVAVLNKTDGTITLLGAPRGVMMVATPRDRQ